MRVLVTGHRGYIGSVLTCVLRNQLCEVVGLDVDLFDGADFGRVDESVPAFDMDVRDIDCADLASFDAVVHLAAVSDDDSGSISARATEEINVQATLRLAECCRRVGVPRFVFASTCAVYGESTGDVVTEYGPYHPVSDYAASKLAAEAELARLVTPSFSPVFVRLPTVYGVSPRMRLDSVVNDFVGSATATGTVAMRTAGHAFRPVAHVEDVAKAFAALVAAPAELVHGAAFNVVPEGENFRVIDIADEVAGLVPDCTRERPRPMSDRCSYRVDGSKLTRTLPRLKLRWNLTLGVRQLYNAMTHAGLTAGDWRSDRYRRGQRLRAMLEHGEIDNSLRRQTVTAATRA
jgi:nucleoside-diphosphate-sugar epimerase